MEKIAEYLKVEGTVVTGIEKESKGTLERIVIPEGMTEIGEYAFMWCDKLKEITIPRSVKNIAEGAFCWCTSLETVQYSGTLEQWYEIDDDSLLVTLADRVLLCDGTDIKSFTELVVPEGVTKIGKGTFYGCLSLERVVLPASLSSLPPDTFFNRSILKAEFGGTKEQWLALDNDDFTSVECKDGVVGIKDIPPYLVIWGSQMNGFKKEIPDVIVIPEGVTVINAVESKEKKYQIKEVSIPASVTEIGFNALHCGIKTMRYGGTLAQWCALDNDSLFVDKAKHIFLGDGTDIKALKEIVIPEGVTKIGRGAFYVFRPLERVVLPESLNSLPSNVFSNKSALKANFGGTKEQWLALGNDDFTSVECKDGTVGIKDIPPYLVIWGSQINGFKKEIPDVIVIPEGVTCFSSIQLKEYIEDASEKSDAPKEKPCSITDITIPASVRYIGRCSCFNELKTVRYGGTLAQWCDLCRHASHIGRAEHIFLGDGTDIKALEKIVIPEGVRQINDGAFNGFTKLSSIIIPPSVRKIGSAFGGCTNLTSVIIPCRVVKIDALTFRGCAALTSVSIPSSVRKISWKAFDECPKLKDVQYGGTKEQWRNIIKHKNFESGGVTIHCSDGDIVTQ